MLGILLTLASAQGDFPKVHRAAFEDRSRMVLIQTSATRWIAFNPKTCAIQKIWDGEVEWRGKVFDFSQDNSRAKGKTLFDLPYVLATMQRDGEWTAQDATITKGVATFMKDGGTVTSPPLRTSDYSNIYVAFDETARIAPFRIEVLDGGKVTEWFNSTTHGGSDTDYQWNYKQIWPESDGVTLRFSSPKATAKKLRGARVFGDYNVWTSSSGPVQIDWRGYELKSGKANLFYEVSDGTTRFSVVQSFGHEMTITTTGSRGAISYRVPPGGTLQANDTNANPISLTLKEQTR